MTAQTQQKEINAEAILDTIRSLNQLKGLDMILDHTLLAARTMANAEAGSIYLFKDNNLLFSHVQNDAIFGKQGAGAQRYTDLTIPVNSDTIVGHSALTKQVIVTDDAYGIPATLPYHFNAFFDRANSYQSISILTIPLLTSDDVLVGVMQLINTKNEQGKITVFSEHSKTMTSLFANNAAMSIERAMLNRELILRMVKMAELHDPEETGPHVQRVSAFSAEIYQHWAEKRNLPAAEIKHYRDLISLASMLHDAGKVGISDNILNKPAKLTTGEFNTIKKHTIYGARLFTNTSSELDKMIRDVTLHHHEKWNGGGYPGHRAELEDEGPGVPLTGEEIPLAARIVALADVFDALCSDRSYKESWDREKVYDTIRRESGRHFDPELVQVFFEITDILNAIQKRFQEKDISLHSKPLDLSRSSSEVKT